MNLSFEAFLQFSKEDGRPFAINKVDRRIGGRIAVVGRVIACVRIPAGTLLRHLALDRGWPVESSTMTVQLGYLRHGGVLPQLILSMEFVRRQIDSCVTIVAAPSGYNLNCGQVSDRL